MTTPADINRRNRKHYGQSPMPQAPIQYQQRLVAYIDIIGWSNACRNPSDYARVAAVAQRLSQLPRNFNNKMKELVASTNHGDSIGSVHREMEAVAFSDNLAISIPIGFDPTLFFRFLAIACRELLTQGFLVRGGITLGDLHHVENMIFGPALIDAVMLENTTKYPRIQCSDGLVAYVNKWLTSQSDAPKVIINDHCECQVVNILAFVKQSKPASWRDIENKVNEMLQTQTEPRYREKWIYMRDVLPMMICAASGNN